MTTPGSRKVTSPEATARSPARSMVTWLALTRRYPCCTRTLPTNVNSLSVTSLLSALTSRSESVGGMLVSILANGSMNCPSHCRHRLSIDVTGTEISGCQSSNGRTVRSSSSSAIVCWVETPIAKQTALTSGLRSQAWRTTEGNEYKIKGTDSSGSSGQNHKAC